MKKIAIIPARSGSKRIPNKNIIDFFGKPLLTWTIEAAVESQLFDRILLSTDSVEIANVGKSYGLEVPFLRKDSYDDFSTASQATITALSQAESYYKEQYETVVQLLPNVPIRNSKDIIHQYTEFKKSGTNFQISYFKFGWMNPWWAVEKYEEKKFRWIHPEVFNKRSQELPELFCPSGAIWIAKCANLKSEGTFYGSGFSFCELNWKSAVDIDTYEDLEFAKAVYLMGKSNCNEDINR